MAVQKYRVSTPICWTNFGLGYQGYRALTGWEREIAAMVLSHVDIKPARPWDLLKLPLRAWRSPQVVKTSDYLHHGRDRRSAGFLTQTCMRTYTVVDVRLQRPVRTHRIRRREEFGFAGGADLRLPVSVGDRGRMGSGGDSQN